MSKNTISKEVAEAISRVAIESEYPDSFGLTLNSDFSLCEKEKGLVVTIASKNIPSHQLSAAFLESELAHLSGIEGIYFGVFRMGDGNVSIDVNVIIEESELRNAKEIALAAGQKAIFNIGKLEVIDVGGSGESTLEIHNADAIKMISEIISLRFFSSARIRLQAISGNLRGA